MHYDSFVPNKFEYIYIMPPYSTKYLNLFFQPIHNVIFHKDKMQHDCILLHVFTFSH